MRFDRYFAAIVQVVGSVLVLSSCSTGSDGGPTVAYREAESQKSLEVPPDLTRPTSSSAISVDGADRNGDTGGTVLPEFRNIDFVRAGASSWLEIRDRSPEDLWPRVDSFLRSQGLTVARRQPTLGLIETGWAERFDSPDPGGITGWISGFLGSVGKSNLRDRYKIFLERMDSGGTRVFVVHRVAEEVDTRGNRIDSSNYVWAQRGGDPAIEEEMTRRLLVYLGLSQDRSETVVADARSALEAPARYVLDGGAARIMVPDTDRARVFARVGDALLRIDADIRQSDRERGAYVVAWTPPKGEVKSSGLFGLFSSGDSEEQILEVQLFAERDAVRIKAADEGTEPRSGPVHRALLRSLAVSMGASPEAVRRARQEDEEDEDLGGPSPSTGPAGPSTGSSGQ